MDENLSSLWKTILGEIEVEVSKANYLTFIKNTFLLSINDNTATIAAPSNMAIDLLKKRFSPVIKKILDKHCDGDISVVFVPKSIPEKTNGEIKNGPLFSNIEEVKKEEKAFFPKPLSRVRPDFTFQNMAVSGSNQLAFVSAQTVAKNLGTSYNPLFIYGPVGVGKTHLMQAIANEVCQKNSSKKIIYTTSEEFTNEVVEAIRFNDTMRLKKRFRSVDLLLIDDVQFLAGKERVQEELFHTFNILVDNSAQVVLSSDRPPSEIKKIEKRLSSRFSAGLTVDIEPPDFELKTAIVLIKAKKQGFDVPIEIAKSIAEKFEDIRSLEGALLRIITEAKTNSTPITPDIAGGVLNRKNKENEVNLHPDEIIKTVCSFYNIKPTLIKGPKRDASIVRARQIIMYFLKKDLGITLVEIGNLLGGRDHTTIMHGLKKIDNALESKKPVSVDVMGITKLLLLEKQA